MKPKALKKRLVLNKKTIADLNEEAMGKVYGGCATRLGDGSCGGSEWFTCACPYITGIICVPSEPPACILDTN